MGYTSLLEHESNGNRQPDEQSAVDDDRSHVTEEPSLTGERHPKDAEDGKRHTVRPDLVEPGLVLMGSYSNCASDETDKGSEVPETPRTRRTGARFNCLFFRS